jgi:hypothetical protein
MPGFAHDRFSVAIREAGRARLMSNDNPDPFGEEKDQPDLFGADAAPPAYRPDPDKVRSRLQKILGEARAAKSIPWEPTTVTLYRQIFPQMSLYLPEDEGAQLRFEFETEIARLEAA